jgi:MFS transporter, ACS family, D-galactonate transporter
VTEVRPEKGAWAIVALLFLFMLINFADKAISGAVLAINSAVGTSAGIIAPYLMGSVIEGASSAAQGYSNGFTVCGVVTLVGGVIALFFLRPEKERAEFASRANAKPALALA